MRRREAGGFVCDESFFSVVEPSVLIREAGDSLRDFLCLKSKASGPDSKWHSAARLEITTDYKWSRYSDLPIMVRWYPLVVVCKPVTSQIREFCGGRLWNDEMLTSHDGLTDRA